MERRILFLTGMVRTGTTLISRAIHAHPRAICPANPFLAFFKAYRNDLHRKLYGEEIDFDVPLSDFFCTDRPTVDAISKSTLVEKVTMDLNDLRAKLEKFALGNAPKVIPYLGDVSGEYYSDVFQSLLGILEKAYPRERVDCVGFMQGWVEAFAASLLNTWNNVYCVHLIRDPRAVIASWKYTDFLTNNYPFLMIIRHWRKSVAIASLYSRLYDRYLIVKYEDFVSNPRREMERIGDVCQLGFDPKTLDVANYRDGSDQPWTTNTSYEHTPSGISSDFTAKWKERLTKEEIQFIEALCGPEMAWCGYARMADDDSPDSLMRFKTVVRETSTSDEWIDRYKDTSSMGMDSLSKELMRWFLFKSREGLKDVYTDELLKYYFINEELAKS